MKNDIEYHDSKYALIEKPMRNDDKVKIRQLYAELDYLRRVIGGEGSLAMRYRHEFWHS